MVVGYRGQRSGNPTQTISTGSIHQFTSRWIQSQGACVNTWLTVTYGDIGWRGGGLMVWWWGGCVMWCVVSVVMWCDVMWCVVSVVHNTLHHFYPQGLFISVHLVMMLWWCCDDVVLTWCSICRKLVNADCYVQYIHRINSQEVFSTIHNNVKPLQ